MGHHTAELLWLIQRRLQSHGIDSEYSALTPAAIALDLLLPPGFVDACSAVLLRIL